MSDLRMTWAYEKMISQDKELDRLRAENERLKAELAEEPSYEKLKAFWEWSRDTDRLLFQSDWNEILTGKMVR